MKNEFLNPLRRKSWLLLALVFISSCSNEDIVKHPGVSNKYDPNKPQVLNGFTPEKGGIGDKIILEGNFGPDPSAMKVVFAGNREANIISTDGASIYCTVPKQPGGNNSVKVIVGDKELTTEKTFAYKQIQKVSTVCGTYRKSDFKDGSLYEALFNDIIGINMVAGDNIVAVETHSKRVRLISQVDNQVTTIMEGLCSGKPAINKARDVMYFVELYTRSGKIYRLRRENNWGPELIRGNIPELAEGEQWSCALDNTEKYLYIRNHTGMFVRVCLEEKDESGQLKVEKLLDIPSGHSRGATYNYIVYSPVEDCFYTSDDWSHVIHRISKDPLGVWSIEEYAGILNVPGYLDGDRKDAKFQWLSGMTVDSEGNLYVADIGSHSIRKISYPDGIVSTVAGGKESGDEEFDGLPLESTFRGLRDIAVDSEDNFYIAGGDAYNIRKLAIE